MPGLQGQASSGVEFQGTNHNHTNRPLLRQRTLPGCCPGGGRNRAQQVVMSVLHRELVRVLLWKLDLPLRTPTARAGRADCGAHGARLSRRGQAAEHIARLARRDHVAAARRPYGIELPLFGVDLRPMAAAPEPRTVDELRLACREWPLDAVHRAVAAVVPEPGAALVAAWLVDPKPSSAPPLTAETVVAIWRRLRAGRH